MPARGKPATIWSDEVKKTCKQLLLDGLGYHEVAAETGVPHSTIHGWYPGLRVRVPANLPETVERQKGQPFTNEDKIRIYAERNYERQSVPEIAKRWNSTPQAIGRLLAADTSDPAIVAYRREREMELMDKLLKIANDALDEAPDLPKVNFRDAMFGVKAAVEARIMTGQQATSVVADPGKMTVMDLARMMREQEEERERRRLEAQPLPIGRAEITGGD